MEGGLQQVQHKKSFRLPTQLKCFWGENEEEYLYLYLEKILGSNSFQ